MPFSLLRINESLHCETGVVLNFSVVYQIHSVTSDKLIGLLELRHVRGALSPMKMN